MSKVKRLNFTVDQFESVVPYASEHGQYVRYADYAKLEAEAQALREEVAALRMARDDFKLERDLARQNFCDEQAANYQLQAHLKSCLGELPELRARVVVPQEFLERIRSQLDLRAEFDQTYPPETQPVNDDARLLLELRALLSEQA
ncbi:hypothetical protein GHT56_21520 [Pseudomonas aeruginosa]|nr:hypothetical protein [Pseudomonas aeruginosa]MBG4198226.1 hypothetical protein [Pseudomonas aeruginosa]